MRPGSSIVSQRVNSLVWIGNIHNHPARKSSEPTICRETDVYSFWTRPSTVTLSREGTTINSALYSAVLTDRLKPAF
jgi:hypothetical protein